MKRGFAIFALWCVSLLGKSQEQIMEEIGSQGVSIDLINPIYEDGCLKAENGGLITGPNIRIQAQTIEYRGSKEASQLTAEGNLAIRFANKTFIGQKLEYDFLNRKGFLYFGRTGVPPWYFGGKVIELDSNGNAYFYNAYVTASEKESCEWMILADTATLYDRVALSAKNVRFTLYDRQIFWLPSYKTRLNAIFDSPVRYTIKWGGEEGFRLGLMYEVFDWNNLRTFIRADWRARRGFGGGFETRYRTDDCRVVARTINYVAADKTIVDPNKKIRYRYQGLYRHNSPNDRSSWSLSYDKLSDMEMATDYSERTLSIKSAGRTEFWVRHLEDFWIANLLTRARINDFQTVNQQLPSLKLYMRPIKLERTGIIMDSQLSAANLDFVYSDQSTPRRDYGAIRVELDSTFYKPIQFSSLKIMPQAGLRYIFYSNSPAGADRWLTTGLFSIEASSSIYRCFQNYKHLIYPYAAYYYYTLPSVSVDNHYIFSIDDGWYRLNQYKFGIKQDFISANTYGQPWRVLTMDLYANAFFDTPTITQTIPKAYLDLIVYPLSRLRYVASSGWDFQHGQLDHIDLRCEWTVTDNLALTAEYLHRSRYAWRKADRSNFILDSYRTTSSLLHSQVSDRRDTLLYHLYYRAHPLFSLEATSRMGWKRRGEPSYLEFQVDATARIRTAWHVQLSYQHKESDKKFAIYTWLGFNEIFPCYEPRRLLEY